MRTYLFSLGSGWVAWLAALLGAALFGQFTAPDPGAAAGGAADPPATDPADAPPEEGADPAAAAAPDAEGGDPDPEDDDDEDAGLPPEVRDDPKRLRTRLRRAQRSLASVRPVIERLRGPNGELPDVEQILHAARQYQSIEQAMQRNPKLRQVLYGDEAAAPAADREPTETPFDETTLPFDTTTPEGKYFADLARRNHESTQALRRLEQRLDRGERLSSEESAARHEQSWQSAALAAASKLPREIHDVFVEAVYGNFFRAKTANQLGTTQVQAVINRLLKSFKLTADQRTRASHAAAARTADNNRRLPAAPRGGAPAGPQRPAAKPETRTVADVSRDFIKRNAG